MKTKTFRVLGRDGYLEQPERIETIYYQGDRIENKFWGFNRARKKGMVYDRKSIFDDHVEVWFAKAKITLRKATIPCNYCKSVYCESWMHTGNHFSDGNFPTHLEFGISSTDLS